MQPCRLRRVPARLSYLSVFTLLVAFMAGCDRTPPTEMVGASPSASLIASSGNLVTLCFRSGNTPVEGVATLYDIDVDGAGPDIARGPFLDPTTRSGSENFIKETTNGCAEFDVPEGQYSFSFAQFADVATATSNGLFISADPVDLVNGMFTFTPAMEAGNFAPVVSERKGNNVSVTVLDERSFDESLDAPAFEFTGTSESFAGDFNLKRNGGTLRIRFFDLNGDEVTGTAIGIIPTLREHPWDEGFQLQDGTKPGVAVSWVVGGPALLTNLPARETIALEGIFNTGDFEGLTFSRHVQAPRAGETVDVEVRMESLCCTRVLNQDEVAGDVSSGRTDILPPVQLKWLAIIDAAGFVEPLSDGGLAVVYNQNPNGATETTRAQFRARSANGSTNGHFDFTHDPNGDCSIVPGSQSGPLFTTGIVNESVSCRANDDGTVEVTIRITSIDPEFIEIDVNLKIGDDGDAWPNTAQSNDTRSDATILRAVEGQCDLLETFPGDGRWSIIAG